MCEDGKVGVAIVVLLLMALEAMRELNSEWLKSAGAWILERKLEHRGIIDFSISRYVEQFTLEQLD